MAASWLYRVEDGQAFAYTDGSRENYYLVDGGEWWAYQSADWLYSPTSSQPLGWIASDYVYDPKTNEAL